MTPNIAKIGLLALAMALLTVMVVAGKAELPDVLPLYTLVVGYAAGNGVNAYRGQDTAPLFKPVDPKRRAEDEV